jgi:GNAT superfamily N-acetyltransferase
MTLAVRRLTRSEAEAAFDDLARLRIEVFRDFPYLYDGDLDYERRYLATYLSQEGAAIIGAFDGSRLVGAATASPLANHFAEFAQPFAERGLDVADFYYFGESVLEKAYRGRGIGVRFFEEREKAARQDGFTRCIFSAVVRPARPSAPARGLPVRSTLLAQARLPAPGRLRHRLFLARRRRDAGDRKAHGVLDQGTGRDMNAG